MKNHHPVSSSPSVAEPASFTKHPFGPAIAGCSRIRGAVAGLLILTAAGSQVSAALRTWDGDGSSTNSFWSNTANWDVTSPVSGDSVAFSGFPSFVNTNDISGLTLNGIAFNASGYSLLGTAVTLNGGLLDIAGANTNGIPLILGSAQGITNSAGLLQVNGNITNGAFDLTFQVDGAITVAGIIGNGSGGLIKNGAGPLTLTAVNGFSGQVTVNDGLLVLGNANAIPSGAGFGDVTVGPSGILDVNGANRTINGLNGSGTVLNANATAGVLTVGANATNSAGTFNGSIQNSTGVIGLTKLNTNMLTLNGANPFTGPLLVSGGTLKLGASATLGPPLMTFSPGAAFDVTSVAGGYTLGTTLTAGRPTNGPVADVVGDLVLQSGGALNVFNSGSAGTLTINGGYTFVGGQMNFDFHTANTTGGGTNDLITINGALAMSGVTLKPTFLDGTFSTSPYTIVNGVTSFSGSTASITTTLPRGLAAAYATGSGNLTVTFSGTPAPANLVWNTAGGNWDVNLSQSWLNGVSPDVFLDFDNVSFPDLMAGTISLPGSVTPGAITMSNVGNYTFTGPGTIGGGGSLTKTGTGTLTFQNGGGCVYTGPTVINGGVLLADFNNAATPTSQILYGGSVTNSIILGGGTFRISSRGNTVVSQMVGGTTVNPGASTVDQAARQANGNEGTYIGVVTRNVGGTLDIAPQAGLDANLTGIFTGSTNVNGIIGGYMIRPFDNAWATRGAAGLNNGGIFNGTILTYAHLPTETNSTAFNTTTNNVDMSSANTAPSANRVVNSLRFNQARTLTLSGTNTLSTGGLLVTANAGASQTTGGALQGSASGDLIVFQLNAGNPFVINSLIVNNGGASALTKGGAGILQLTANNTYSGTTYINAGTLQVGTGGTSGGISNSAAIVNNGTLTFNRSDTVGLPLAVSGNGGLNKQGAGSLLLTGDSTYRGVTTVSAGTLQIGSGGTSGSISNSSGIVDNSAVVFNRSDNTGFPGPISGSGSVTKQGAGTLSLDSTNSYLGPTIISAGTLALGSLSGLQNSTPIIISNAATFDVSQPGGMTLNGAFGQTITGNGSVTGAVTTASGSFLIPGSSVGNLTFRNELTLNGGRARFEVAQGSNDLITVNGTLALNAGQAQIVVLGAPLTNGSYRLFQYNGALSGSPDNIAVIGFAQAGQLAYLTNQTAGRIDLFVYTGTGANLTWAGDGGANNWDVNTSANWVGALKFNNNDNVTFDDSSANLSVNLVGNLFPGSVTVNAANNYIFGGTGLISGGTGLVKQNSGTLTLLSANDYTGPTTVSAGTIQMGDGATAGNIGSGDISNSGALVFNEPAGETVVPAAISGSGTLSQSGAGSTVTLSGDNSFTGLTTVGSGATLQVGSGGAAGSLGGGSVLDDGLLVINRSGLLTVSNSISGLGGVNLQGGGIITLSGNNTYTNNTTNVVGTTVLLGFTNAIPDGTNTGTLTVNGVLEMNARDEIINALAGNGTIRNNNGSGTNLLTVGFGNTPGTFAGLIQNNSGAGGVIAVKKVGSAQQQFSTGNTYSGGTTLAEGILRVTADTAMGTGPARFEGGTLNANGRNIGNPLIINQPGFFEGSGNNTFSGTITGTNVFTLNITTLLTFGGAGGMADGFSGTFYGNNAVNTIRFFGSTGSDAATWDLGTNTLFLQPRNRNTTVRLGALQGGPNTGLSGTTDGTQTDNPNGITFAIGAKNLSTTFEGQIINAAGNRTTGIRKTGSGTLTLTGTTLTYSGPTTVENGVLALGAVSSLPSTSTINIISNSVLDVSASGTLNLGTQVLSGDGTVRGSVVMTATSTLRPGNAVGTLTVTNTATLAGNVVMELAPTNTVNSDRLVSGSTLTYGGVLTVTNVSFGGLTNGTYVFQLFSAPTITGSFDATNLPALPLNKSWDTSELAAGRIKLVVSVDTTPTNIVTALNGNSLQLTWPASHIGWRLQAQTNTTSVGLANNWVLVPNSDLTNTFTTSFNTSTNAVFYRMVFP